MKAQRLFEIPACLVGLVVMAPVMVASAIAVRVGSPGPALFRQVRVGYRGRDFTLYKFRTMIAAAGREKGRFDAGDTSRVTRVGRLLRASKLDELPQLWNVLRGDMALVGPRPEVRSWIGAYPERWAVVHSVRPGITDPASIAFRHEDRILAASADPEATYRHEILPRKLAMYEQYVNTRSFLGDCAILCRTALALARRAPLADRSAEGPRP